MGAVDFYVFPCQHRKITYVLPSRIRNQDSVGQMLARRSFLDTFSYAVACVNEEVRALIED
jgi:hypothetical protein